MSANPLAVTVAPVVSIKIKKPKAALFPSWCRPTRTTLEIEKPQITFADFQEAFNAAEDANKGHQWWIGDLLNLGEQLLPEEYAQVLDPVEEIEREESGESYRQYQQVAFRIKPGRRLPDLSFSHHQAVAYGMTEEEQDEWLARASKERWSVDRLRKKIKRAREGGNTADPADDLQVLANPELRQWLTDYRRLISAQDDRLQALIEKNPEIAYAKFLHRLTLAHIAQTDRQLERTSAIDCDVVRTAIRYELSGTFARIEQALRIRGYFMSSAQLNDTLELLINLGEVTKRRAEAQRHEDTGQRGEVPYEYRLNAQSDAGDVIW